VRVRNISIKGLFGRFDYEIPLNLEDRITIIHGPNGFGKTAILRLIAAIFGPGNQTLLSTPFVELQIDFDNGANLTIVKIYQKKDRNDEKQRPGIRFVYQNGSKPQDFSVIDSRPGEVDFPLEAIDEIIPELDRVAADVWRNIETGEFLHLEEVLDRYSENLSMSRRDKRVSEPDWLKTVRKAVPTRLIEAERLQTPARPRPARHPRAFHSRAVKLYSGELGATIKQTLTEYATLSQSLDRTFPMRVITHSPAPSVKTLQTALQEIEAKRVRLVQAGLLEQEGQDTGVQGLQDLDKSNLPVLAVYAQDTNKKLSVFDPLVAKVELFKKSVNDRFLYKQLSIGKEGFTFVTPEGQRLDPINLSSGEQHEVVLLYQLLFQATENSLILLDEPEISLHVAWQEQFLPGLQAITAISGFDALIATHSPQVIGDRWDLTVELKGPLNAHRPQALPVSK
jgi:predicted ATP-binding protein involved in virulence